MLRKVAVVGFVLVLAACGGRGQPLAFDGGRDGKDAAAGAAGGGAAGTGGAGATGMDSGNPDFAADVLIDAGLDQSEAKPETGSEAGGACTPLNTVASCGPTCDVCTAPTGGTATCASGICDFTCVSMKKCSGVAKLCIPTTGCCDNSDCPMQNGKVGTCDTGKHACDYACPSNTVACNGACIPFGSCCGEADCAGSCRTCSADHQCVPVKDAEDDTCQGDHICDTGGSCLSRFKLFPRPNGEYTWSLAAGKDGNLWFSTGPYDGNAIGRMTIAGAVTMFTVPTANSHPSYVMRGADGNIWFSEPGKGKIGSVTPAGQITEYTLDPEFAYVGPLAQDPSTQGSNSVWFATLDSIALGVASNAGSGLKLPTNVSPIALTFGSDSKLWYVADSAGSVGRIDLPNRQVTNFPIPTPADRKFPLLPPGTPRPLGIALGADGAIWFTENDDNQIGRIDKNGMITEFDIPTPASRPGPLCLGPDGNIWFIEQVGHGMVHLPNGADMLIGGLARITPDGKFLEYALPQASGVEIVAGPDGNLWISDGAQIIRFRMK